MAVTVLEGIDGVRAAAGRHLGASDWLEVTTGRLALFESVVGAGPDAMNYLVLSLSNHFLPQIVEVRGVAAGVNYGVDRVRFLEPVHVGSRLRGRADLVAAEEVKGGVQTVMAITIEATRGADAPVPVCLIDSVSRWLV